MLNHQSIGPNSCQGCDVMKNAFECALCSFLCDSETVFRTHLNVEHKSNFLPCVYCETLYNASHFLLRHLKATHSLDVKVYHCGSAECTFKTTVLRKFLSHLDLCTGGKAVRCYHCKSTFSSSNLLMLHIQGKLKILFNKAYKVDKVIRIVSSPVSQSVPVFQTNLDIREPKSSILSNLDKTGKTSDVSPVDSVTDQTVSDVSSASRRLSYILPKMVVAKPVEKTVQTYSSVTTPRGVSVTRQVSHDENSLRILKSAVILPVPPNAGNSNTLLNGASLSKNSVFGVSSSGKLTNISLCQIPSLGVTRVKPPNVSGGINKTAVITAVSPSPVKLENVSPKKDTSDSMRKGTQLVTLPLVKLDITKNVSVKNTIPNNKMHCGIFPQPTISMPETSLPVSAELNSSSFPSLQNSSFKTNMSNFAFQKRCIKIAPKVMLIPVSPPSSVLQPGISRSNICTAVCSVGVTSTSEICCTSSNMSILSSVKQNSAKMIESCCMGSSSQVSSQSSLIFPSSSVCKLNTISKAVPELSVEFPLKCEDADQTKLSSSDKSVSSEIVSSFTAGGLISKLCTSCSYSEKNCDTLNYYHEVTAVSRICSLCGQNGSSSTSDGLTLAAQKNSFLTTISKICQSTAVSPTFTFTPACSVIQEELTVLPSCSDVNKIPSVSSSSTFVTYVKQEAISSCDAQFETAVSGLPVKCEVTSHEKICDRFNGYYGDIAAVVSNHTLLSQKDSNGAESVTSDSLISDVQQNPYQTSVSQNDRSSACTSSFSVFTAIKEEPPSPPFSCIDLQETSSSSISVSSVMQEIYSYSGLQCKTPPLSPIIEKIVALPGSPFSNSFNVKTEISVLDNDFETVSSAIPETLLSPSEKNSDCEVIKPIGFSGVNSSHSGVFISSCDSNLFEEKSTPYSVHYNANGSELMCSPVLPVSSQCIKSVIAFSTSSFTGISQDLSNIKSSVNAHVNGFKPVTSLCVSHLPDPAGLVNRDGICDVTFTTLAIKPKVSSNSSLSRAVLRTVHEDENSTCDLPLCAPATYHSKILTGTEVCGISSPQNSCNVSYNFVPGELIIASSTMGCLARTGSFGSQSGSITTVMSSGINEKISSASCVSQICTPISISINDSQHTSVTHSSSVASSCEIISKDQPVSAAFNNHQSSLICVNTMENCVPRLNLCSVTCNQLSGTPALAEESFVKHRRKNMMSCNENDEFKSIPSSSSSSSLDERHPFLNSTNMTVRQILEKFRGKHKGKVNASRKSSSKSTRQTCKNVKYFRKQHIECSSPLSSAASATVTRSVNETILNPFVLKEVTQLPADTGLTNVEDTSTVSCKRKANEMLEADMENQAPKVQKFNEQVMPLHDHTEKLLVHYTDECKIKSEVLPSDTNEQSSISGIFDQYCFSQLENEALSDSHRTEDMCSATDILQVARELLSYNETPGEITAELSDICQALKRKKSEKTLTEMLQPLKLKDFFKCMARHCSYTSNICVEFSKHLKEHDAPLCTCAYCLVDFPAPDNLICHLMQEHKKSLFQCSLCFYRAFSQTQVCIHFRKFHSCVKGHIITCSPVDIHPILTFNENYMAYYASMAKPYSCCFYECSFSCIAMLDVIHHILYCHPVCSSYVCTECEEKHPDILEWLIHYQVHGIHLFHCIHCAFGAETRTDMLYHISMYHANESLVVFVRSSRYLMLQLEHILKYRIMINVEQHFDISNDFPLLIQDQVILENTVSVDRTLKCLYCQCSKEYVSEMQNHLYTKHNENDVLHYYFCQSQFQMIPQAEFILENLLSSSNEQSPVSRDTILANKSSFGLSQPTVPLRIIFEETSNGVVNLQLPLIICKQNNFSGKYMRIFQSLYNQIQSKIHRKRFKCLYCQKTERYLYKLRQHWRCCHVQTGKKFKYELINRKRYKVGESSCEICLCIRGSTESCHNLNGSSGLNLQKCSPCQCCIGSHKTSENISSNWNSVGVQNHHSQCGNSLRIRDYFSFHKKLDNGDYCNHHSSCYNFLHSTKVPSEEEHSFHKCNCLCEVRCCTVCQICNCCAEARGSQICTYGVENKVQQLENQCTGKFKSYGSVASRNCLIKCSKKAGCIKKQKSSAIDKYITHTQNVKLKVFLRKLPYSVKLPVLYLKQIINLNPVVVLLDIKYQREVK